MIIFLMVPIAKNMKFCSNNNFQGDTNFPPSFIIKTNQCAIVLSFQGIFSLICSRPSPTSKLAIISRHNPLFSMREVLSTYVHVIELECP